VVWSNSVPADQSPPEQSEVCKSAQSLSAFLRIAETLQAFVLTRFFSENR